MARCLFAASVGLAVVGFLIVGAAARSITTLEAPRGCEWRKEGDAEGEGETEALLCRLRTIASAPALVGNLSAIQAESVRSLGLECSDVLFFESQLDGPHGFLGPLPRLHELRVEYCKIRHLPGGVFASMHSLRRLTLRTHNSDWSAMTLELHRDALRGLPELRHLDLAENNIWILPAELLCPVQSLASLNVTRNKLQDVMSLGLSEWATPCAPNLEVLDLSGNDLGALPDSALSGLRSLTVLKLQDNVIAAVGDHALTGLTSLQSLNVSSNKLVALPPELFSNSRDLRELILSNNSLAVLAPGLLEGLDQLQSLDLSSNELTSQWVNRDTFARLVRLVVLDVSFNSLTRIDSHVFADLYSLQVLKLEHNDIDTLTEGCFGSLRNLHSLTLSHNRIARLDPVHTVGLTALGQLFLDSNNLRAIHPRAFVNLTDLQDLSLSGNSLNDIPDAVRELRALKTLDLGNNHVSRIDNESFAGLDQLYGLRLVDNKLENVSREAFASLPALQVLNLASNTIRHVEQSAFANNPVLRAIRLDGNQLTEIRGAFTSLSTLVWLNVSDNKLLWFDYSYLPSSLEWLDMHANQVGELGNYYMVRSTLRIKMLDASFNLITEISDANVPDSVETLFLNNNKIRNVAPKTFLQKTSLEKVVLYGNEIRHLERSALGLQPVPGDRELPMFYIGDNPIFCDCNMEWLPAVNELARLRQHPRIMDLDSVTCEMSHARASPRRPLLSLKPRDFLCHYETHCFALCHCCDFDACDCEMTCPDNCSCYHDHSWSSNVVDCSNAGYNHVPERIPMDATEIYLDGNELGDLGSHVFLGKRRLEVLYLNNSGIAALHNRTFVGAGALKVLHLEGNALRELRGHEFDQLERVAELYLDHNAIATVGNDTFTKLKGLEVLRLDNNRIVDFPPWTALPGAGSGVRVALEGNAWSCECANAALLRTWLTQHPGDSEKMYCRDGAETIAQAMQRCGDPATEAVSRGAQDSPILGGNFVPLLAGALVAVIAVCLFVALAFAFRQDVRLWAHAKYGLRLGKATPPPDEERDRLFDGYIVYSGRDEDFVSRCLAAELEQSGLALCLHWRDLPPARPQEAVPPAAAAARRVIIVFSPVFLSGEWQHPEFRSALRAALEGIRPNCRRRRVVILLAAEPPTCDPELQLLLQTCTVIVWGEKRFWEKLRFAMPDSEKRRDGKKVVGDRNRAPARYTAAPSAVDAWSKPNGSLVVPVHAPTPTPTQSTYVSSASSRTEDEDSGAEHQHHGGYSALHTSNARPPSLSSRGSHLYSTIPEPPGPNGVGGPTATVAVPSAPVPTNPRTYFV
ncbi:toll-like receptor Tollo [Neodiprion virginianus]|uniref:toll-like receptor Tollo n=1 Tax=Neodiprion fabricii TaxID=2872261 RepID=UPI001ED92156|nr:toll-like receptor Tollo [Neodiprion fabricii]XP_046614694.1 toll-like receptor Tollo [Neodiprion virginianus]